MKGPRLGVTIFMTALALCGVGTSVARAQSPACTLADYVLLGERVRYDVTGSGGAIYLKTAVTAGRSYNVLAWGPFGGGINGEDDIDLTLDLFSDNTCATPATVVSTTLFEPSPVVPGHAGAQVSIIPATTGPLYIRARNNGTDAQVQVVIVETTMFSPWWFTGGTNQAYIEVTNNMSTATSAVVTVRRANGSVCGTTTVPLTAGGNAAVEINGVGTCAAALSGSSQISFNGTLGGLTANTTTINVPAGTSFDSPFSPRMVWSLFSR